MRLPHLGVRRRVRTYTRRAADLRHWLALRRLEREQPSGYRAYLHGQMRRTLSKRATDPGVGAQLLIQEVASRATGGAAILCIGCRNGLELDRFRSLGLEPVGIDLFSARDDILVMDMHKLQFPDDSFDAVYASHSLEHAYDLPTVLAEIARVGRDGAVVGVEVPLRHKGSDADVVVFSDLDAVRAAFAPIARRILHEEEQPARTARNEQGSAVARLVFGLAKG